MDAASRQEPGGVRGGKLGLHIGTYKGGIEVAQISKKLARRHARRDNRTRYGSGDLGAGFRSRTELEFGVPAWLQVAQMPGGRIAERIFSGLIPGLLCGILFQAGLFSAIALSIIYVTRLIRGDRDS